jgi:hypothetical protein
MTSSIERAITIRDHALDLALARGKRQAFENMIILTWHEEPWWITHRKVIRRKSDDQSTRAQQMQSPQKKGPLPYGLDVWREAKVLGIDWSDDGRVSVITFERGAWEDELLSR